MTAGGRLTDPGSDIPGKDVELVEDDGYGGGYGSGVSRRPVFHAIRGMPLCPTRGAMGAGSGRAEGFMSEMARFQETLRRLAMIDEAFVRDHARLGLCPAGTLTLDARTTSLLQLAVSVAIGSPGVCLEWSTARAVAAGATDDEIADVLLAIAPVVGLGRVVCAAPEVASALGYDIGAALEEPDDR
jgi:4-carboxymuconolactone decarboxylase